MSVKSKQEFIPVEVTIPGRFTSALLKVEQAKKHIDRLEREIIDFWSTSPYGIEVVGDPKNATGAYRIKGDPAPLPDSLTLTAGDAAHNLRSALDHFACASAATTTPNTAFPVWRAPRTPTPDEWRGLVFGKLQSAPTSLINAVIDLRIYKGGTGQDIWALDELDRVDKHRLLIPVTGANTALVVDFGEVMAATFPSLYTEGRTPKLPVALRPVAWTPVTAGVELFSVQTSNGFNTDPKFIFEVALAEPDALRGKPVAEALRHLACETESLLQRLVPLVPTVEGAP
jgi:hypothetical protein